MKRQVLEQAELESMQQLREAILGSELRHPRIVSFGLGFRVRV